MSKQDLENFFKPQLDEFSSAPVRHERLMALDSDQFIITTFWSDIGFDVACETESLLNLVKVTEHEYSQGKNKSSGYTIYRRQGPGPAAILMRAYTPASMEWTIFSA